MSPAGVAFVRSGLTVLAILGTWVWWTYYGHPMWRQWGARNIQPPAAKPGLSAPDPKSSGTRIPSSEPAVAYSQDGIFAVSKDPRSAAKEGTAA